MNPKEIVRAGYDKISYAYRSDDGTGLSADYANWLTELMPILPAAAPVLDLGCGCGLPVARLLATSGFAVTGIDISPVQIERARPLVPAAQFRCADMTELAFPSDHFAAIVSFYALIHVPIDEQKRLLAHIFDWLQPGGYLLATVGYSAWTGTEDNWLGVEGGTMYWSHADETTYRQWLADVGFAVRWTRFVPEGSGGHTLVLAQKPHDLTQNSKLDTNAPTDAAGE